MSNESRANPSLELPEGTGKGNGALEQHGLPHAHEGHAHGEGSATGHEVIEGELVDEGHYHPPAATRPDVIDAEVVEDLAIEGRPNNGTIYYGHNYSGSQSDEGLGGIEPVTAVPAMGGGEGGDGGGSEAPAFTKEDFPDMFESISEVARLKKELESKVGFGKKKTSNALKEAQDALKAKVDNRTEEFEAAGISRLRLNALVNEAVADTRIELADTEVKGFAAKVGQGIEGFVGFLKKHKKAVIGLTAAGAVVLTGGIVLGVAAGAAMGAAAVTKGLIGAGAGLAVGTTKAYFTQQHKVAQDNLQEAVRTRYAQDENRGKELQEDADWHGHSREYRDAMGRMVLGKTAVGGAIGAGVGGVVGFAAGASIAGYTGFFGGGEAASAVKGAVGKETINLSPAEINEAQKEYIKALIDNGQGNQVPGLENFNPDANTQKLTTQFDGEGKYYWSKVQNAENWSNGQTLRGIENTLEYMDKNGINVKMRGAALMTDGGDLRITGSNWHVAEAAVDSSEYPDGVYLADPNNLTDAIRFEPGHKLSTSELAAITSKRADGWVLMQPDQVADQLAERIAEQMPDTADSLKAFQTKAVETLAKDATTELSQIKATGLNDPDALAYVANQKQAVLQGWVAENAQVLRELPAAGREELVTMLAQQASIPAAVVRQLMDELFKTTSMAAFE
ncbi:MAG: hypothetical protein ACREGD_04450 [Candidatus Saccharimonadales bacterium]